MTDTSPTFPLPSDKPLGEPVRAFGDTFKASNVFPLLNGLPEGPWIVTDAGDGVIGIQTPAGKLSEDMLARAIASLPAMVKEIENLRVANAKAYAAQIAAEEEIERLKQENGMLKTRSHRIGVDVTEAFSDNQRLRSRIAVLEEELNHYRTNGPTQRYWEGRWRDEKALNADLCEALREFVSASDAWNVMNVRRTTFDQAYRDAAARLEKARANLDDILVRARSTADEGLCPVPATGTPEGIHPTVSECVRDGNCGCDLGDVLKATAGEAEQNK